MGRGVAIVIGGAVAKGAFAAGALAVLTEKLTEDGTPIRRLVGTSSGALNATMIAAGVRAGDPVDAAKKLTHLWEDKATAWRIVAPNLASWFRWRGVSGTGRIIDLLNAECPGPASSPAAPVSLRIVVTPLAGVDPKRTTFEHVERFEGADLDDKEKRDRVFHAAAASAAFPFAFEPVAVHGVGPCVDGGVVNNTPIGEAIDQDPEIDVVYVISADPAGMLLKQKDAWKLGGFDLVARLVEMLIDERLTRDLAEARAVNAWVGTLKRLVATGGLTPAARDEVVHGLYPNREPAAFRHIEIVEIRPEQQLKGNPFKGFFCGDLRRDYVEQGRAAARAALRLANKNKSGRTLFAGKKEAGSDPYGPEQIGQLLDAVHARAGGDFPHLLVVDDDTDIRESVIEILEGEGFTVAGAVHGADGLAQARERRPDLIVLDMMMPVMDGREFLAALRSDPALATIPVVTMAGDFAVESGPTPPRPAAPGLRGVRLPEEGTDVPEAKRHSP